MEFEVTIEQFQEFTGKRVESKYTGFVEVLLREQTNVLKQACQNYGYMLDLEISTGRIIDDVAVQVVCELTDDVFENWLSQDTTEYDNLQSITQTTGVYSETRVFSEVGANARAYIAPKFLKMLGISSTKYGRLDI